MFRSRSWWLASCLLAALWLAPTDAGAQPVTRLHSAGTSGTIDANGDTIVLATGGLASLAIQALDTYSGTWEVQCSLDSGTTYDADDEVLLTLVGATSTVSEVTDTVGIWQANVAGCTHVRVIATAGFAASDTAIRMQAVSAGGSGGGGGAGGASDTELPAAALLAATDVALPTAPMVGAALYCYDGATLDLCPTSDGGAGAATANTSRTVEATTTAERYISAGATEDENEICAAACTLVSIQASNNHASANAFVKCTNLTAANTTPGTSAITYDILVPFGLTVVDYPNMPLSTALTCYIVLGEADNDVAEVAANDVRYIIRTR